MPSTHRHRLSRRRFGLATVSTLSTLSALSALFGSLALSGGALGAGGAPLRRRFVFVHAVGGWDPLCVFAPMFASPVIEMEPESAPATAGDFALVTHPARPAVVPFFDKWGARTLLLNGLSTRSVNHETCQVVALTGQTSDGAADWPTMLGAAAADDHYMPHLVFGGPAFVGENAVYVSRAEGLVEQAVNGELFAQIDAPVPAPSPGMSERLDGWLGARAGELGDDALRQRYATAVERAQALARADVIDFPSSDAIGDQIDDAVRALGDGVARCVTLSSDFVWDTHGDNSQQSYLYEQLFTDLDQLLDALATTQAPEGHALAEDTVVVVLSEMGRTPAFNGTGGRDHWPFTSALLIGSGIAGGRTLGGFADNYTGIGIHPTSGELDPSRAGIDARSLGATLLALGDVDPEPLLPGAEILAAALA